MKQRLLIWLTVAALLAGMAGCQTGTPPVGSGGDSVTTEDPSAVGTRPDGEALPDTPPSESGSDSGTEPETQPEPIPPYEFLVAASPEILLLGDEPCFSAGSVTEGLVARDFTFAFSQGETLVSMTLGGWVGFDRAIDCFGYRLDGEDAVYGNFAFPAEEEIKTQGGEHARRYAVTAPLFGLTPGSHTLVFVARLADGTEAELLRPITLVLDGLITDRLIPYHAALTHVNGMGPGSLPSYTNLTGNHYRGLIVIDADADEIEVGEDGTVTVNGWLATEGGVDHYAWTADGVTWYPISEQGHDGEPSPGHFAELGYENAAGEALMRYLTLDLFPCNGHTVTVTLGAVPKDSPGRAVPFLQLINLTVPDLPDDISYSFHGSASFNPEGTELSASDLADFFTIRYGAGNNRHVMVEENTFLYHYEGIHAIQANMDGQYAMTATVQDMSGTSFFFARGVQVVRSVEPVQIPLHNYYETDGAGLCGGAGIYAKLSGGVLTLVIKGLDPGVPYRVRNYIYEYPAAGSRLTLADDGKTVYVLVDGKEITRVTLEGAVDYPQHLAQVSSESRFAATATLIAPSGQEITIQDTLVAATCNSGCGAAVRGGTVRFTGLEVVPFSESGVNRN